MGIFYSLKIQAHSTKMTEIAFGEPMLNQLSEREPLEAPFAIQANTIYTAVDVNYGKDTGTTIVSFAFSKERLVIVGFESFKALGADEPRKHLYAHIDALLKREEFSACVITLIIAANIGSTAESCAQLILHRYPEKVAVMCSRANCYGVFEDSFDAEQVYVECLRYRTSKTGVFFDSNMVCNAFPNEQVLDTIETKLFSIPASIFAPSSVLDCVRVIYDNLAMTLAFGVHWHDRFNFQNGSWSSLIRNRTKAIAFE
jgi:hypothetical protein